MQLQELRESLHTEKQQFENLTNKFNQQSLRTREFETKSASQKNQLDLAELMLTKNKSELLEKDAIILKMRGEA